MFSFISRKKPKVPVKIAIKIFVISAVYLYDVKIPIKIFVISAVYLYDFSVFLGKNNYM